MEIGDSVKKINGNDKRLGKVIDKEVTWFSPKILVKFSYIGNGKLLYQTQWIYPSKLEVVIINKDLNLLQLLKIWKLAIANKIRK